jgi:hypothetical protein
MKYKVIKVYIVDADNTDEALIKTRDMYCRNVTVTQDEYTV